MNKLGITFILSAMLLCTSIARVSQPIADLIVRGGKIWTGDAEQQEVQAVALWNGRILALGSDEDINQLLGEKTRVIELNGRRVVPGFYDSHVHLLGGGMLLSQVNLKDAENEAEFGKRIREFDQKLPRDRWLLGGNWDHDRTFDGKLPTRKILDQYVPDRPAFLRRYDGHMALANTRALNEAGITQATKDPDGGVIERDSRGVPTGILKDNAMGLVARKVPPTTPAQIAEAVRAALAQAREVGVTSVQDMAGMDARTWAMLFRLYQQLAQSGDLTCRIDLRVPIAEVDSLADLGIQANYGNDWVRIGGVKGFMDGSLGSSTAKMFEPYTHDPTTTGVFVTPRSTMLKWVTRADQAGISVAVHAIGDRANAELLSIFEQAAKQNGRRDRRFRIEHAQHLRPVDIPRFAKLNVIASMQPYHIIDDGRWAEGRIGKKRCETSYANRSLLDAGATLAFGSDWPVAPLSPILGIDAAVNRCTLDGKHPDGWFPKQKITVEEALKAYTWGSAYAGFQESERGTIKPGKLADLVILSADMLDPKNKDYINKIKIDATIVGGKVVYQREK